MEWKRKEGETYKQYGLRLYKNRTLYGLNNNEVADVINKEFPEKRKGESAHRKYFAPYSDGYDDGYEKATIDLESKLMQGRTPTVSGLKSLMPKSHLENMRQMIDEYTLKKRDVQLERNELAKMMRYVTPWVLLTEQYREAIREGEIELPEFKYDKVYDSGDAVIKLLPADWHIGAIVNEEYNQFNFEIAVRRIDEYCRKAIEMADRFGAKTFSITHLGDIIEGIEMRTSQKWDCEFLMKDQLKHAKRLYMRMIQNLSQNNEYNVIISGVYGNHDRLVGDKNKAIGKDNAMAVIIEELKDMIEFAEEYSGKKMERISFEEHSDDYKYVSEEIFGSNCRWQHGHEDAKNDERKIEKYSDVDMILYNVVGFGHLHHGRNICKNRNNKEIYGGSLMGANDYAKSRPKSVSDASQSLIVFTDRGEIYPMDINLQNA